MLRGVVIITRRRVKTPSAARAFYKGICKKGMTTAAKLQGEV